MHQRFTCDQCPLKSKCQQPCAAVDSMLPSMSRGRLYQLRRMGALANARRVIDRIREARMLTDFRDELTGRVRVVFDMHYNQGMTHEEIAFALNIDRRTAGHYLDRAREIIGRRVMGKPADGRKCRARRRG